MKTKSHRRAVNRFNDSLYWLDVIYRRLDRDDGPAVEDDSGGRRWYRNGFLHREDGPAVEWPDGSKSWYRNGRKLSPESSEEDWRTDP